MKIGIIIKNYCFVLLNVSKFKIISFKHRNYLSIKINPGRSTVTIRQCWFTVSSLHLKYNFTVSLYGMGPQSLGLKSNVTAIKLKGREATFRIELKIHLYERCVITILTKLPCGAD